MTGIVFEIGACTIGIMLVLGYVADAIRDVAKAIRERRS